MLRKVDPTVSTRYLLLWVQVLKVSVAELVRTNETTRLGIADILHLAPPLSQPDPSNASQRPCQRDHFANGMVKVLYKQFPMWISIHYTDNYYRYQDGSTNNTSKERKR
jgi:hypothetical protein